MAQRDSNPFTYLRQNGEGARLPLPGLGQETRVSEGLFYVFRGSMSVATGPGSYGTGKSRFERVAGSRDCTSWRCVRANRPTIRLRCGAPAVLWGHVLPAKASSYQTSIVPTQKETAPRGAVDSNRNPGIA